MDTNLLVAGGDEGLRRIAEGLERNGVRLNGAYAIRVTTPDGVAYVHFTVVTDDDPRTVIFKYGDLRKRNIVPSLASHVRFSPRRSNYVEADRVLDYARKVGSPIVRITNVIWRGLYIEDAVVVKWRH